MKAMVQANTLEGIKALLMQTLQDDPMHILVSMIEITKCIFSSLLDSSLSLSLYLLSLCLSVTASASVSFFRSLGYCIMHR